MYSVHILLKHIYNVQTKWILLQWLKQHKAASPSIGLEYKYGAYRLTHIY